MKMELSKFDYRNRFKNCTYEQIHSVIEKSVNFKINSIQRWQKIVDKLTQAYLKAQKKKLKKNESFRSTPEYRIIFESYKKKFDKFQNLWEEKIKQLKELQTEKASLPIPVLFELQPIEYFSDYEFSTQTSPSTYSRSRAMEAKDVLDFCGIESEIKREETKFVLYAPLSKANYAQCHSYFSKHYSFSEMVRLCWKRGANPRVRWPFLPHGFEKEHGFNYFGEFVK